MNPPIGGLRTSSIRNPQSAIRNRVWPVGLLLLVTCAVYANALGLGFVWDDHYQILRNHWLRDPHYIPQIFTSAFWDFLNPNQRTTTNFYRPLQSLTYMLCYGISGLEPWSFHLASVLLHVGVTLMAYALLRRWTSDYRVALAAALASLGAAERDQRPDARTFLRNVT